MPSNGSTRRAFVGAALAAAALSGARAASYPTSKITLIVAFAPGTRSRG